MNQYLCPICGGNCSALSAIDFNKTCADGTAHPLDPAQMPVTYYFCERCGFCFAPEIAKWSIEEFEARIYNDEYARADPDYLATRPLANAQSLVATFNRHIGAVRHLDYGGGSGLLSQTLRDHGWNSSSYDPFVDRDSQIKDLGKFDLITAYEVFEHVPDVKRLIGELSVLLADGGIVLFSTLLSNGNLAANEPLTWWYAAPRNGHISLFSAKSLELLGQKEAFKFASYSTNLHVYWRTVPAWAAHILRDS